MSVIKELLIDKQNDDNDNGYQGYLDWLRWRFGLESESEAKDVCDGLVNKNESPNPLSN